MSPLTPSIKELLLRFASSANWSTAGNAPDMERFSDFVISAYRNNEHDISLEEFLDILGSSDTPKEAVFGKDLINKKRDLASKMFMFTTYENGIQLLKKFEEEV